MSALAKGDRGALPSAERFLEPQFVAVQVVDPGRPFPEGAVQIVRAPRCRRPRRGRRPSASSSATVAGAPSRLSRAHCRPPTVGSAPRTRRDICQLSASPARAPQAPADDPEEPNNRATATDASRSTTDAQRDAHMPSTHPMHHVSGAFRWDVSRARPLGRSE